MKRIIRAASDQAKAQAMAQHILEKAKVLFDTMEDTPTGFIDANSLAPLYRELGETIQELSYAIESGDIEYSQDRYGVIQRYDEWAGFQQLDEESNTSSRK